MSPQRLELLNIFADGSTVVVGRFKSAENSGATLGAIIIPRLTLGRLVARETRRMSQLASRLTTLLAARQPQEYGEGNV